MANRNERRRAAKAGFIKIMDAAELMNYPSGCAWSGCGCISDDPDKEGWSKLVLYRGPTKINVMEIAHDLWDRDAVLCPDHAKALHEDVLANLPSFSGLFCARPQGRA